MNSNPRILLYRAILASAVLLVGNLGGCYRWVPKEVDTSGGSNDTDERIGPSGETARSSVELKFDWPDGLRIHAEGIRRVIQNNQAVSERPFGYRIDVSSHKSHREVRFSPTGRSGKQTADTGTELPDVPVPTGRARLGAEGHLDAFAPDSAHRSLDFLEDGARGWWRHHVEIWTGRRLKLGASTRANTRLSIRLPPLSTTRLPVEITVGASKVEQCPGIAVHDCVALELRRTPDVHSLRKALQRWVDNYIDRKAAQKTDGRVGGIRVESVYAEFVTRVVTDASSLIPVQSNHRRIVRLEMQPTGEVTRSESSEHLKFLEETEVKYRAVRPVSSGDVSE